jgi:hypothetical protein
MLQSVALAVPVRRQYFLPVEMERLPSEEKQQLLYTRLKMSSELSVVADMCSQRQVYKLCEVVFITTSSMLWVVTTLAMR